MRWSWKLGAVKGIGIYVHYTFLALLAWILLSHLGAGRGLGYALGGVLFMAAVFGIVVLHELGHALAARRYGIGTRDITLWPIGGIARLERMPDEARQELVVAACGPAVNVALAAAFWGVAAFLDLFVTPSSSLWLGRQFLHRLIVVNVGLAVFNLLPAFPMDGGRILRALLAFRMDYVDATRVAAAAGKAMAVVFGVAGLFFNPMLILIAFFVWSTASNEAFVAELRHRFGSPSGPAPWHRSENQPRGTTRYRFDAGDDVSDGVFDDGASGPRSGQAVRDWWKHWWYGQTPDSGAERTTGQSLHTHAERRQMPLDQMIRFVFRH